ncbi:MAG: SAP domain-containing protein, partial [Polyangiaceae bacterium]|nr:SAP domain-containing protein [Polyangiaceae bacterium]
MNPSSPLLQALTRNELLAVADYFSITVADRRAKAPLLGAVAGIRNERLGEALSGFPRDRLKELCRELGLDDAGREKSILVERLLASPRMPASGAPAPRATKPSEPPAKPKGRANGGDSDAVVGFEEKLW